MIAHPRWKLSDSGEMSRSDRSIRQVIPAIDQRGLVRVVRSFLHADCMADHLLRVAGKSSEPCSFHADLVMNDLIGNHIEQRHGIPRPGGRPVESGTVFVGMRSWYYVASGNFSVVNLYLFSRRI
jgi:hypothetical protein